VFGVNSEADFPTVYDVLLGECQIEEAIQKTAIAQLDVLPANHDLIGAR